MTRSCLPEAADRPRPVVAASCWRGGRPRGRQTTDDIVRVIVVGALLSMMVPSFHLLSSSLPGLFPPLDHLTPALYFLEDERWPKQVVPVLHGFRFFIFQSFVEVLVYAPRLLFRCAQGTLRPCRGQQAKVGWAKDVEHLCTTQKIQRQNKSYRERPTGSA